MIRRYYLQFVHSVFVRFLIISICSCSCGTLDDVTVVQERQCTGDTNLPTSCGQLGYHTVISADSAFVARGDLALYKFTSIITILTVDIVARNYSFIW